MFCAFCLLKLVMSGALLIPFGDILLAVNRPSEGIRERVQEVVSETTTRIIGCAWLHTRNGSAWMESDENEIWPIFQDEEKRSEMFEVFKNVSLAKQIKTRILPNMHLSFEDQVKIVKEFL